MGSDPRAGSAVSTNNASNTLRMSHLNMANILDDICEDGPLQSPKLECQISNLSREIERQSGGLLDQRDAAVDLRQRLKGLQENS